MMINHRGHREHREINCERLPKNWERGSIIVNVKKKII